MSNTLLPCPFCGGEVSIALCGDGFDAWWFITRGHGENTCKCRLIMESEKFNKDSEMADFVADDLIAAWNRRADHIRDTTKKVTNADRIRSMSDGELADWIDSVLNQDREDWDVPGCYYCINYGTHHSKPENKGTYLYECADCPYEGSYENGLKYGVRAWLKQPAKEE